MKDEVNKVQKEVDSLSGRVDSLSSQVRAKNGIIDYQYNQINNLWGELSNARDEKKHLEDRNKQLQDDLEQRDINDVQPSKPNNDHDIVKTIKKDKDNRGGVLATLGGCAGMVVVAGATAVGILNPVAGFATAATASGIGALGISSIKNNTTGTQLICRTHIIVNAHLYIRYQSL